MMKGRKIIPPSKSPHLAAPGMGAGQIEFAGQAESSLRERIGKAASRTWGGTAGGKLSGAPATRIPSCFR